MKGFWFFRFPYNLSSFCPGYRHASFFFLSFLSPHLMALLICNNRVISHSWLSSPLKRCVLSHTLFSCPPLHWYIEPGCGGSERTRAPPSSPLSRWCLIYRHSQVWTALQSLSVTDRVLCCSLTAKLVAPSLGSAFLNVERLFHTQLVDIIYIISASWLTLNLQLPRDLVSCVWRIICCEQSWVFSSHWDEELLKIRW